MTTPDLLTRCRAVLARLHSTPLIPASSVDDDVLDALEGRWLAFREPYGRHSNVYATLHGAPFCADPSTFTLDHDAGDCDACGDLMARGDSVVRGSVAVHRACFDALGASEVDRLAGGLTDPEIADKIAVGDEFVCIVRARVGNVITVGTVPGEPYTVLTECHEPAHDMRCECRAFAAPEQAPAEPQDQLHPDCKARGEDGRLRAELEHSQADAEIWKSRCRLYEQHMADNVPSDLWPEFFEPHEPKQDAGWPFGADRGVRL